MDGLITLADLPKLKGTDPAPRTQIAVARLDDNLRDPRYGKFGITQADVDGWKRNLSGVFGGRVSIDFDHSSDRGKGTKAAAWITGLHQDGKLVTADVEFTPGGAKAVRDQEYLYISPTFVENYKDEHGQPHGKALLGAALTNRPVLRKDMPTLSLSRTSFDGVATLAGKASKKQRKAQRHARTVLLSLAGDSTISETSVSDSRGRMDLKTLAKQLGLDEDADQATILAAVVQLPEETEPAKTPVAQAAPVELSKGKGKKGKKGKRADGEGAVLTLSAEDTAQLITAANAGQAAAVQLAEHRFEAEWTKTLDEGRVAPSQEETFRALFAKDAELAVKTLSGLQRIVPTAPRGNGEGAADSGPAPAGVDEGRYQLHTQALERAKQLSRENTHLTPDEAYAQAAIEIDDQHTEQMARGY